MAQQRRLESSSYWKDSADCSFPPSALTHQGHWRRQYQHSQNSVSYNQAPSHPLHPEHVHRQETLETAPQSKIPSILPTPCLFKRRQQKKMQAGGTVKTKGLIAEGRGESNRIFQRQEGSRVTSLETTSSQKEKFWKRIWGWDSGGEDWKQNCLWESSKKNIDG